MAFADAIDNLRGWVDDLNPRERRLLGAMAVVMVVMLVLLPMYLAVSSISSLESDNSEIAEVLQDIYRSEGRLQEERAERRAVERLYARTTPSLGGFLEERAQQHSLGGLEVTDQPEVAIGPYKRRSVRASLSRVPLRPLIEMLADIKNSSYPVAVERIQLDGGARSGGYLAKFAVNAYDLESGQPGSDE